mmetsp:Transcript_43990/g.71572  ORF Transcript_43990/g.71572 Transcript_43990/m.71572 type:complete len:338 (+) Transcript_43990:163-1176(+)|eukprot:CAMPEP_0184659366 /NCGR_PEP_ID=MMETSP0308-20130426/29272_1 /TAXON_ID=38269 /ORGANISM="Gloeochaete witrockiana, Strain SAG 46.84" /LENGTH=337 /DNA_ID=CAMNT_0027099115 /DNA_START=120 /DNA_END=1133 /DNA_ORIENTATION=+
MSNGILYQVVKVFGCIGDHAVEDIGECELTPRKKLSRSDSRISTARDSEAGSEGVFDLQRDLLEKNRRLESQAATILMLHQQLHLNSSSSYNDFFDGRKQLKEENDDLKIILRQKDRAIDNLNKRVEDLTGVIEDLQGTVAGNPHVDVHTAIRQKDAQLDLMERKLVEVIQQQDSLRAEMERRLDRSAVDHLERTLADLRKQLQDKEDAISDLRRRLSMDSIATTFVRHSDLPAGSFATEFESDAVSVASARVSRPPSRPSSRPSSRASSRPTSRQTSLKENTVWTNSQELKRSSTMPNHMRTTKSAMEREVQALTDLKMATERKLADLSCRPEQGA